MTECVRVLNDNSWEEPDEAASSQLLRDAKKDLSPEPTALRSRNFPDCHKSVMQV